MTRHSKSTLGAPRVGVAALTFVLLVSTPLAAGGAAGILLELREGSFLVDQCVECDRADIVRPLAGTLVLTAVPSLVGSVYEVSDVQFADPGGDYAFEGSGLYNVVPFGPKGEDLHELSLELSVNGEAGHRWKGEPAPVPTHFPTLDVTTAEAPASGLFRVFTLHIVAAPPARMVRYELVEGDPSTFEGSFFIDDCLPCGRPTIPLPVAGTFLLGEVDGAPNPVSTYRLDSLRLRTAGDPPGYTIDGSGSYRFGGEVALVQEMQLVVEVNGETGVRLASSLEPPPPGVERPEISIDLRHVNPVTPTRVFSLHLVARPAADQTPVFRRADANGDDRVDISDAVFTLLWRFAGGETPGCLDAADSNGDLSHDITDAIFTLEWLFRGGPTPPPPGPDACGPAPGPSPGCEKPPPCAKPGEPVGARRDG